MNRVQEQLLPFLKQIFGSKVELAEYRVGNRRHDYVVILAQLVRPSIRIVLKLAGPQAPLPCPFERTALLYQLVARRTNIPMTEVLAVDVSCRTWPWRYLVMTHVAGQEWSQVRHQLSPQELDAAFRQLGQAVAELHAIRFPLFGEVGVDGTVEGSSSWVAAMQARAQRTIRSDRLRTLFLSVLEGHVALFADMGQASLCHEDLHGHNILFDLQAEGWRLATILDFDKAWAGHAEIDLARLELWTGMMSSEFWQTYQDYHPIVPQYSQRRPIYQLLWCLEYAQPTRQHLANTAQVCRQLGISWPGHFEERG